MFVYDLYGSTVDMLATNEQYMYVMHWPVDHYGSEAQDVVCSVPYGNN